MLIHIVNLGIGDWGLGIGDWGWGLGIGDWGPIPNPQSPIPNPQSPIPNPPIPRISYCNLSAKLSNYLLGVNIICLKVKWQ